MLRNLARKDFLCLGPTTSDLDVCTARMVKWRGMDTPVTS
jgi:hypothetical protein